MYGLAYLVREVQIANMMNQGREGSVGSRDVNILADLEKYGTCLFQEPNAETFG